MKILIFSLVMVLTTLTGCSNNSIKIKTTPEDAIVSIIDDAGVKTQIGKTPLDLPESAIFKNQKYADVLVEKDSYKSREILLTRSLFGTNSNMNISMEKEIAATQKDNAEYKEKLATSLAKINTLIQLKQYNEAEVLLNGFVNDYPDISVGYDYLANVLYMKKDYLKALSLYRKAHNINPQSMERKKMMEKISELTGRKE